MRWRAMVFSFGLLLCAGCGDDEEEACTGASCGSASSSGAGGSPAACTDQSRGTLQGTVYDAALPPNPDSAPAAGAFVVLRQDPAEVPLNAQADDLGRYQVELPIGHWIVEAEDGEGCFTEDPTEVDIAACEATTVDLALGLCQG